MEEKGYCDGYWICSDKLLCNWKCLPPPKCEMSADCYQNEPGDCLGFWACSVDGECFWLCDEEKECLEDNDCADFPPVKECAGYFKCENYKCLWKCEEVEEAEEAGADAETAQPDEYELPADPAEEITYDDTVKAVQDSDAGETSKEDEELILPESTASCGCYQGRISDKSYLSSILLFLLVTAVLLFKRRSGISLRF